MATFGAILRRGLEDARYQEHERPIPLYSLPKPCAGPFRLRVLTLNVWGLPFVSGSLEERIDAICDHVCSSRFDLIGFQEAFHPRERDKLRDAASAAGLVYQHVFRMGVGIPIWPQSGSTGLCVVSRYPIVQAAFHRYVVNGKIHKLYHGDYVAAKGVGLVRVCTPAGPVDVYISHLHSCYETFQGRSDWDEYKPTRVAQGFELARFVQHTRRSPLAVLMGDLNSAPDDQVLDLLRVAGRLRDAFAECNPRAAGYTYGAVNNSWGPNGVGGPIAEGGGDPTALPARTHAGNTDNSGNSGGRGRGRSRSEDAVAGVGAGADEEEGRPAATWADRDVDPDATRALRDRPTRMDYVLFSAAGDDCGAGGDTGSEGSAATPDGGGAGFHAQGCAPAAGWSVRSCRIVRWRTPDGVSVSDHFGVAATFAFDARVGTPPPGTVCAVPRMATAGTGAGARSDASPPVLLPSHAASVEGGDRGAGRAAYAYACDRGIGVAIPPSPDAASVECSDGSPGGGGGGVSSSARRLAVGSCPAWEVHSQLPPPVAQASGAHRDGGSSLPALTSVPLVDGLDLEVHVLRECQAIIVSGLTDAQRRKGGHARRASRAVLVMAAYGLVLAASAVAGPGAGVEGGDVVVKAGHGGMGPAAGGVGPATPPHPAPAPGGGDVVNGAAATALSALALVVPILGAYATVELLLCWFAVGDEISGFEEVREQMEVCSVYRRALRSAASAS